MEQYKEEIEKLNQDKNSLLNKMELINTKINNTYQKMYDTCSKINNGHNIIREREPGLYGEYYSYCTICGLEY
jgi:peptidoglycan hydrolase CwlO-like protein